jgi:hypothetical protein
MKNFDSDKRRAKKREQSSMYPYSKKIAIDNDEGKRIREIIKSLLSSIELKSFLCVTMKIHGGKIIANEENRFFRFFFFIVSLSLVHF